MKTTFNVNCPRGITDEIFNDNQYPEWGLFKLETSRCFKGSVVLLLSGFLMLVLSFGVNAAPSGPGAGPPPQVTVARG